ncbi:transposase [Sphingomonas oligophenolica]|uniref:Transposase n=2 Tax=Sphingomonas oligophenolica TaxID=301154 RepID=A0A502BTR9_9SPHN|nr:helix-turn-helix domain-containing protein [Sphingomonas oligophenolica]TPG03863.1 transposase [Sphingomonas oligophenolica]
MGKPLSMDLRSRALAAVDEGLSCRAAARRFGVAASTVIRWHDQRRNTGGYAAKPQGGDTRSRRIESHRDTVLALHDARRDITLDELRRELGQAGVTVAISTLHRFFARHGITRKKRMARPVCKGDFLTACWSASTYPVSRSSLGQDGFRALRAS